MLPSTKVSAAGLVAAVALGVGLGGSVGAGVAAGFAVGVSVALASALLQKRLAASKPQYLVHVLGGGFLVKIFALFALTLCVRFVAPLGEALEWRAFVLSFAAAVLALLPCTAWELLALSKSSTSGRAPGVAYQQGSSS
jgi:hypothetical protein